MKRLFLFAITIFLSRPGRAQTETYYTCVMHPEIHASKPGKCPKCGMDLVKKTVWINKKPPPVTPKEEPPKTDSSAIQKENKTGKEPKDSTGNVQPKMDEQNPPEKEKISYLHFGNPRTVRYDLYVKDTVVSFSGKKKHAIAINGSIPAPTLQFTEGDTAEVYVHNMLDAGTTIHWHGIFLPNRFDGVPYLTQLPIPPHQTYLYRFPIIQNGTYWYHSHSELQEQSGMYGALILNKRDKEPDLPTLPVVLSDWTDRKPEEVNRSLHAATEWFAIKKRTTQSYTEAVAKGKFKTKLTNEWKRMNAMDVSDVYYEKFLLNGNNVREQPQFKAGDKIRLRVVNGGASSYFWLSYSGGKITVIGNDGNDVEPVEVDRLIIAVAETYDLLLTIPANGSYEFLATPEDRTGHASLWLGSGIKMPAKPLPKLKYFEGMKMMNDMMAMNGDMKPMGMEMSNQTMDMNAVMYPEITGEEEQKGKQKKKQRGRESMDEGEHQMHSMQDSGMRSMDAGIVTLNYAMLKASEKTNLPAGPLRELHFELTGNMNRYVWTLDNKTVSESDKILIKKGENLRIVLYNNSMMRHPMHLHGHDFRLLNGQGDYAPQKNTVDIMPMETDTLEFSANEDGGDWFFHCHILYHMMSGMGRIFSYRGSTPNPEISNPAMARRKLFGDDRMSHFMARLGLESNGSDGEAMLANTRWKLSTLWHLGYHAEHGYESETMVGRYLGKMQWWFPYAGFDYHHKMEGGPKNIFGKDDKNWFGQTSDKNDRKTVVAGIAYTLPLHVIADLRADAKGKIRFQLSREDLPVSPRLRFNWMINTDKEYMAGFRYIATKYISLSTHYDSDMGWGGGFTITY